MKSINKILYREIKPYYGSLFLVLVLMLAGVGFEALGPWPFKFLIDNVLGSEVVDPQTFVGTVVNFFNSREILGLVMVFVYFASNLMQTVVEYFRHNSVKKVTKSLIYEFSRVAFSHLESFAVGFYKHQEIGDYIYRLSYDVSALGEFVEDGLLPLLTSSLFVIVTAVVMFFINVRLTVVSLAAVPFLAAGLYFFNSKIVRVTKQSENWNSLVFSFVDEALKQLKIVQAFSQEHREAQKFNQKVKSSLDTEVNLYRLNFLLTLMVGLVIAISYSFIIGYGIELTFSGVITSGLLIVFIFYLDNLVNPILEVIYAVSSMRESYVKIQRMSDFFSPRSHIHDIGKIKKIDTASIEFKDVTLRGDQNHIILHQINFLIEPGSRTVLVGVSGSGKTSIISLIPRLIDEPSAGKILIGGRDIKDYGLKTLRENISLVPQEIVLFNESIRDNIAFGNPKANFKDIQRAAHLAAADHFIRRMPGGYDFKVGEGGQFLSGGQRQRLMLARALVKDAKIFIADEVFSALDVKTKGEVMHNLYEWGKGRTVILVTNVLDIIEHADNIIAINEGKMIEAGQHAELLKRSNVYKLILTGNF